MVVQIIHRPIIEVIGAKTWISGPDNEQFGRFWQDCQQQGTLQQLHQLKEQARQEAGSQTGGAILGISWIQNDPGNRAFYYMIAIELPSGKPDTDPKQERSSDTTGMECAIVPEGLWAVFPCIGEIPEAIMLTEMYAMNEWLPASGYQHAGTVEMEVYPADSSEIACEFWLQIRPR